MTLHALLVGINEYHPESRVGSLSGCVNDIQSLHGILTELYGLQQHEMLLNEQATRQAVIAAFRRAAARVEAGDTFVFAYSGHGSRETAPQEFRQYFPDGMNETLVCYDSRLPGGYDLADKELAVLLHEISSKGVHVVLIADSCHSGSISRGDNDELLFSRFQSNAQYQRPLESYLDGYYSQLQAQGKPLTMPPAQHIVLAACHSSEKAWEGANQRGIFSTALHQALRKKSKISYKELFEQMRFEVELKTKLQRPQLDSYGVSIHNAFISNETLAKTKLIPVALQNGNLMLEMGAIGGLVVQPDKPIMVRLFNSENNKHLGNASIARVSLKSSLLVPEEGFVIDTDVQYVAELSYSTPNPVRFFIEGDAKHREIFYKMADKQFSSLQPYFVEVPQVELAQYILKLNDESYCIYWPDGALLHGMNGTDLHDRASGLLIEDMEPIAHWEKVKEIQNPVSRINPDDIVFKVELMDRETGTATQSEGSSFQLTYKNQGETFSEDFDGIDYRITASNQSDKVLYFELLVLEMNFGIEQWTATEIILQPKSEMAILKDGAYFYIPDGQDSDTSHFKLFVSTEPIHKAISDLQQKGINIGQKEQFSLGKRASGSRQTPDWRCKTISVKLVREDAVLGNRAVELSGLLEISSNGQLKAKASVLDVAKQSRSADDNEAALVQRFQNDKLKVYDKLSCVQLSDIKGDESLANTPLQLRFKDDSLGEDEFIVAVAFDEFNNPVILNQPQKGGLVELTHLPDQSQAPEHPLLRRSRSLGKAIKLFFFKLIGKSPADIYILRWVDYSTDKAERKSDGLKEKITTAHRILLVVHGIIGDTIGMANTVRFATEQRAEKLGYDLVLTYDYENLRTPIEDIARHLRDRLQENGIDGNDDKDVTILAHSMGGLVSRYFIEKLGGDKVINRLIMAGTPNGGSPFGNIDSYRALMVTGLSFSMGIFAWAASALGGAVAALTGLGSLTHTLGQMHKDSAFIKSLEDNFTCPPIPYVILAGNILHPQYGQADGGFWAKITAKLLDKLGNWANAGEGNDIAVSVDSILRPVKGGCVKNIANTEIPMLKVYPPIPCNHLNYFDDADSVNILKEIL